MATYIELFELLYSAALLRDSFKKFIRSVGVKLLIGRFLVLLLGGLLSGITAAAGATGWMKIDVVSQRDCKPNRGLEIAFTTEHLNPDACSNARVVEVSCELATYKQILAMALTAQTASMQVNANVNGCDLGGQAKVTTLKIR